MTHEGSTRRTFLAASSAAGAGLVLGFLWERKADAAKGAPPMQMNAFVKIGADDQITLIVPATEMGQGVYTSVPMILADELDVELAKVQVEGAPADPSKYGLALLGGMQVTGGSTTIRGHYQNLRQAGAAARQMLLTAAASSMKVPLEELTTENGAVVHAKTNKKTSYGKLVAAAAKVKAPEQPVLKDKSALKLIGKPTKRTDTAAKVKGAATFGIDVRLPNMLIARVVHCPSFGGGKLKSFNASEARKVPGVKTVIEIPTGVAVVADNFWSAKKGADALTVEWEEGPLANVNSTEIRAMLAKLVDGGVDARKQGDAAGAFGKAAKKLEAIYEVPYLAHATMEPLNATADVRADRAEIWVPTQAQGQTLQVAAAITQLPPEKIKVNTTFAGGGFGRKAQVDFAMDAIHLSKALKKPVKAIWAREDDIRGGNYRPTSYAKMMGGLDAGGWPVAWVHRIAAPSIMHIFGPLKDGIDGTAVEGAADLPYSIPNLHVTYAHPKDLLPITTWFWRSVGHSINAFSTECFLDELALLGGKDPLEVRRRLLDKSPRHKKVLETCAEKIGWTKAPAKGVGRGIAVHESFGSFVAEAAEVSIADGIPRVHRVVCAIDCGEVVNPATVVQQMESGIAYGLSAALYGKLELQGGKTVQANFDAYPVVRLSEMPAIETHIVTSGEGMGGVGEPATPPIAPAVCNAILALTKKPVRQLPIVKVG